MQHCVNSFSILAALSLLGASRALPGGRTPLENKAQVKQPVERDIVFEGLLPTAYTSSLPRGRYKIYTGGFEYDRHSWATFSTRGWTT